MTACSIRCPVAGSSRLARSNGGMQVTVRPKDGREVRGVLLSDATYIIATRGFKDLPFLITEIDDIFQSDDNKDPRQRGGRDFWGDWH